ncbi:hypothetical protein TNCV_1924081, partial [Trichonephila clavipes]
MLSRTSCAEDRKEEHLQITELVSEGRGTCRETSPAVLMAEATIPVTTPIKEERGNGRFKGCSRQENSQMIRNSAKLENLQRREGIISSTDLKSVCSEEVITNLRPETYTQSLLNVPNGDLVAVKINASECPNKWT